MNSALKIRWAWRLCTSSEDRACNLLATLLDGRGRHMLNAAKPSFGWTDGSAGPRLKKSLLTSSTLSVPLAKQREELLMLWLITVGSRILGNKLILGLSCKSLGRGKYYLTSNSVPTGEILGSGFGSLKGVFSARSVYKSFFSCNVLISKMSPFPRGLP